VPSSAKAQAESMAAALAGMAARTSSETLPMDSSWEAHDAAIFSAAWGNDEEEVENLDDTQENVQPVEPPESPQAQRPDLDVSFGNGCGGGVLHSSEALKKDQAWAPPTPSSKPKSVDSLEPVLEHPEPQALVPENAESSFLLKQTEEPVLTEILVPEEREPAFAQLLAPTRQAASSNGTAKTDAARLIELEQQNAELETRLDEDGRQFLEALVSLESEVQELREQNRQLQDQREQTEERLLQEGETGELLAKNMKLERESQDLLQQFEAFERDQAEEHRIAQDEVSHLHAKLAEQEQAFQRRLAQMDRDRENLLQAMSDESKELQSRVEKLSRDKEMISLDLAKALAVADVAKSEADGAGDAATSSRSQASAEAISKAVSSQLRTVQGECEALKDEVTNKEGQIVLLRSQLEIAGRKIRLSDMENAMLKSELEAHRRKTPSAPVTPLVASRELDEHQREELEDVLEQSSEAPEPSQTREE